MKTTLDYVIFVFMAVALAATVACAPRLYKTHDPTETPKWIYARDGSHLYVEDATGAIEVIEINSGSSLEEAKALCAKRAQGPCTLTPVGRFYVLEPLANKEKEKKQ